MDIRKALIVKFFRELLTIATCLNHNNKCKPQISNKQNEYKFIVGTSEKQWRPHTSHKKRSTFQLKALCVNFFVNRVAAEDKNNIVYKIDCGNREAVNPNCL